MKRREARGGPGPLGSEAGGSPLGGLVLAIFGPTAAGKSAVAEAIARASPAEVISADSMQVYRGLPVLTSQPTIATRLVAIWDLDHGGSVGEYQRLAHAAIDEILATGKTPVVAGGTGLYFRAAVADLSLPPGPERGVRETWERLYDRLGPARAHAALAGRDPDAAAAVHPNDRRRVVRALELADAGHSLRPGHDRLWAGETRHPTLIVGLDVPPDLLAQRIEKRTVAMFDGGAVEEARRALSGSLSRTARQVIGLQEIADLPREEAIAAIVVRTRRYAAYQRKWMRRIPGLVSLSADRPPNEIAAEILALGRAGTGRAQRVSGGAREYPAST